MILKLEDVLDIELFLAGNSSDSQDLVVNFLANWQSLEQFECYGGQFIDVQQVKESRVKLGTFG